MKKFFQNNSLSICFAALFVLSWGGQTYFGYEEYLKELSEMGARMLRFGKIYHQDISCRQLLKL